MPDELEVFNRLGLADVEVGWKDAMSRSGWLSNVEDREEFWVDVCLLVSPWSFLFEDDRDE